MGPTKSLTFSRGPKGCHVCILYIYIYISSAKKTILHPFWVSILIFFGGINMDIILEISYMS